MWQNTAVKYDPSVFYLIFILIKSIKWLLNCDWYHWFWTHPRMVWCFTLSREIYGLQVPYFFSIDDTLQRSSALTRNTVSHQFIHFWWKICSLHCNWHLCHCVNGERVFSLLLLLLLLLVSFNVDGAPATDGCGWAESIWFQCESHWRSKQLSGVFWWGHIFHLIIVSDVGLDRDNHQDRAD